MEPFRSPISRAVSPSAFPGDSAQPKSRGWSMGLSAGTGRSPAPLGVSLMTFLCTFVAAASVEAPAGFCPAPGLHVSSVCGRSQICLQAPRLRLLSARRAANRARLSQMCSRDDDTHDHGESKGTDLEVPKRVESASDPESMREEALREKLERCSPRGPPIVWLSTHTQSPMMCTRACCTSR